MTVSMWIVFNTEATGFFFYRSQRKNSEAVVDLVFSFSAPTFNFYEVEVLNYEF